MSAHWRFIWQDAHPPHTLRHPHTPPHTPTHSLTQVFLLLFVFANPTRLPIYLASDIIQVSRTLVSKVASFRRYRKLAARLEADFPDATLEELEEADTCIICRDMLTVGSKKLICGHILHFECLKSWFVHHQSCPTCRTEIPTNIIKATPTQPTEREPAQPHVEETPGVFRYPAEIAVGSSVVLSGIASTQARASSTDTPHTPHTPPSDQWATFLLGPPDARRSGTQKDETRLLNILQQIDRDQRCLIEELKRHQPPV
eukprot:Blabericola_migrator_1__2113@NODE_1582_length_4235_cov_91_013436_g1034_i0_p3_GENE_NODE_1582_length_4235_cov_91_013436_g1034_i0NODE_1582_length_4235_cov_91_013436_g1034_i0_p3_ORF_typecomplete_len258_score45_10zfRING_2/PF13639_6/4_3e10zfrbx1/PF12678_7/2_4e06zfC3HC4_3/PF13920_6/8_3e07ProkRING_4/PF14447_6/2_6e02ProkRING_4/PF14447_6/7_3e06zfC3HC4_2/PF13923_6/2_6e06zfC3HC4/PF00097_25/6_4e06Zn_ribbon_17/PF17120_5/1_2e05zfRING_5/PF14634_6/0_00095zfANAPC11/PF12861_7/0_0048zfRING_UBOX/PF13445_6/0_0015zfRI